MRFALVALLAGCAFHAHAAGGDDGSGGPTALIDDTAADFQQGSSFSYEGVIDPLGTLQPQAYALGGFHARAYDGKHVSGTTQSWQEIETEVAAATLRGTAYMQLPANWGGGHPMNLGLSAAQMPDDNFTVIYEGELSVPAGDHAIDIDADDAGAIEIDPDGNGFQMFTVDAAAGPQTIMFHTDQARWVPIHVAIGEGTGNTQLLVNLDGAALAPRDARARVTRDHGLLGWFYYGASNMQTLAGPVAVDAPNVDWGMAAPPYDLTGVTAAYTARLVGQLRIDHDGTYTLATSMASVDDSSTLYIDGHLVSRTSVFADSHPTSATLQLTAGWHAIAIEVGASQKNILGGADPHDVVLSTTIADGNAPPVPITTDMVRPAAMSGYLWLATTASTPLDDTTAANGVTMLGLPAPQPTPPTGAVIESSNDGVIYRNAMPSDYTISLDMAGTPLTIPSTGAISFLAGDETVAGAPVPTAANQWTFTVTDTVPGGTGQSAQAFAAYTGHGGPLMPFAPSWIYTSGPRALGDGVLGWSFMHVTGDLHGATLAISVRSAPTAEQLEAAAWVRVANGDELPEPAVPPDPFVEYRLDISGDGWQFPVIDKVEIDYIR